MPVRRYFAECYNVSGGVDKILPVDVYVPGCAARPEAIIEGVAKGLKSLNEEKETSQNGKGTRRVDYYPS